MDRWAGRVALVTGASAGIGAEICRELVKYGIKVIGCARSVDRIKQIAEEPEVKKSTGTLFPIKCDLSVESEILEMFKTIRQKFQRIDILINNAGLNKEGSLSNITTENMMVMFKINVLALCICTRESLQLMKEKNIDDGHIINISGILGHVVSELENFGFYTGTKFMVNALTESLRQELRKAKSHIRTCILSPGVVETEFLLNMANRNPDNVLTFNIKSLKATDVAKTTISVLSMPPHVDISQILVRPTEEII